MTRKSHFALLWLTTLVAACLFAVTVAGSAGANITTSLDAKYQTNGTTTEIANPVAGSHPDYRQILTIGTGDDDDLQRLILDFPPGLIGDPNAIAPANRCTKDYTGVTANSGSPDYSTCATSAPNSKIGTIRAVASSGLTCSDITLNGSIYLLQNRPSADPEVPAYLGIHLSGSANVWLLLCAGLTANMDMTAKITLRPNDQGLRVSIIDDLPKTDPIIGGAIRLKTIDETIGGMAPGGKPFLTVPTRCGASSTWDTVALTRAYNGNTTASVNVDGTSYLSASSSRTGTCTGAAAPAHTFDLTQTTTQVGAPVGLRATLNNPVPTTNANQAPYAKTFSMALPVGFKVNPAIGARLGGVGGGCTESQFLVPDANNPVTTASPTCPTSSQVGNVAVTVPEITGDLTGRIYLGEPRAGDMSAGIYRLYIHAVRGGVVTKFQGTATANAATGQVTVTVDNTNTYFSGLPQFNYSKFVMDFNSNSSGVGSPSSGPVTNPQDGQQMLVNPQWCGSFPVTATVVPWTTPTQATESLSPTSGPLTTTAGSGACAFGAFNPTFSAKLTNPGTGSGGALNSKAGQHPDLTLSVARADRTDNLKTMVFKLPTGFAGSATAAPTCSGITSSSLGTCTASNVVGTVAVTVGDGPTTISMPSTIYNVQTASSAETAKLAIVTPANVGPFSLGNVVSYSILTLDNASTFRLVSTTDLTQSILGIPVDYRTIDLTLNGMISSTPFLTNPSEVCGSALTFNATLTSAGNPNGSSSANTTPTTVTPSDSDQSLDCSTTPQPFSPTLSVTPSTLATAQPTGLNVTVNQSQTAATTQQSTIKNITVTMPAGLEINPGFASSVTACPTATINTDITNKTNSCSGVATKIADVTVNTPLLPSAVTGQAYLEAPGATPSTRYQFVLYLSMPGGLMIVRGGATLNGSSTGGASGSTGAVNSGTGQIVATFSNLPDVPYSSMSLNFNSTTPMFVNSDTIATQTFNASFVPWSTSSTNPATATASYLTNYNGTVGSTGTDSWSPTFTQTISDPTPNAHPNVTLQVDRPEKNQQLATAEFDLPSGLVANVNPTNVPTCTQVLADAANCPANSQVGTVTADVGSALVATPGVGLASLSGKLYNTVAPGSAPAKLTAIVPVVLGPFNLGSMTLPVDIAMRPGTDADPYGLNATVNLPNRYEGVKVRYRQLKVVINGVAPGNGANFMTNPSNCNVSKTTTAKLTSHLANVSTLTQSYTTGACGADFGTAPTITVATNPVTPATQTPVGLTVNVSSAATNPTMKEIKITFPSGVSVNPAVGNYAGTTTCSTANINAGNCAGSTSMGTVSLTTPLIPGGPFTGNIYLETPDPSGNPAQRFRVAMIIALPGQNLIVRGTVTVNGATTVTAGGTGSVDSGTGVITADFDNLPDLLFTAMTANFNTGNRALLVTPTACSSTNTIVGQLYPYSKPAAATTNNSNFNTNSPCVATSFAPTFTTSLASTTSAANSDLTMTVTNPGATVDYLRTVTYHMPAGYVANTNNVARCTQANANAGNCATQAVGTATASVGTNAEQYILSGSIYNVTPNASEPARLQAILPVTVGPYVLGKLSVPVTTSLRSDYGIDATAQLPKTYEGIDIRTRSLSVTISGSAGGQAFMQNPSVCASNSFTADIGSGTTTVTKTATALTINGCPKNFTTSPALTVTPSTLQAADPVGLTFGITSAANNPTIKRVQIAFPNGMEINPAFGNLLSAGGATCSSATVAGCATATSIATVSLTTPLLSTSPISGNVYVVAPGNTAATRYKVVMIVDLPGTNELVVPGAVTVNGSTDIPTASTGATGSIDSGTGQINADFNNIPDLGFTALTMTFNSGAQAMVVNPETATSSTFTGTFTPNSGGTDATSSPSYTPTGAVTAFDPSFTATASTYAANGHPTLTMNVGRVDKSKQLKNMTIHFPAGLTANTGGVPQCTQASAAAASCASTQPTSQVGTFTTSIGSGTQSVALSSGKIFAVVPNATEPARFQAIIPVTVGPYNLGNLTLPISASLRSSDYGIDLAAQLPQRYEGIAVRLLSMQMVINGTVNAASYMNNPSKCGAGTISADFKAGDNSNDTSTANNSSTYTATGCPVAFGTNPTVTVSGVSTSTQTPTGMVVAVNSVTGNPSIGDVQLTMPAGMSLNPAVGNNGSNTTCATAVIDAITTVSDGCPAAAQQGTVSLTSPLLGGTYTGKLYLESPGTTAATRYKLAIVVNLPGQVLIVHGGATVNGSTTIPTGGTGAKDSGTGVIVADFPNIPDLAFSNLTLTLATSNRSMLITPSTCQANTIGTSVSPNGGGAAATGTQSFTTSTNCTQSFAPTFSATLSSYVAGAHPDLTIAVGNSGANVNTIRNFNVKLPVGLVANTTVVPRCPQVDATAGTCGTTTPSSAVGTISASLGASAEQLTLPGTVYNVVPGATEPAHLAALIPVVVGPYNLGNMPVDISTALNDGSADSTRTYAVDTFSTLPTKYEGIDVRVRAINLTVNGTVSGQPFMINPSACLNSTIGADLISPDPITVSRTSAANFTGCNRPYTTAPTLTVTPSTKAAGQPVGLTFDMGTNLTNPTTQDIKITFPTGFELNPAAGTGLNYCSAANLATSGGQATCDGNGSKLGTVSLTTPLLSAPQTGAVYLEQPGTTGTTRYKAAIVVHLPGKDLILHGAITLNGSSTIPTGGTGAVDSGTGQIVADFPGIPDLGFTNMHVAFNSGSNALFVNPTSCSLSTFTSAWTPTGTGAVSNATDGYTPDTNCGNPLPFAPTFTGSVSPLTSAGNPDVTLNFTRPDNNLNLRNLSISLPTGLVAATTATTLCSQSTAAAGNCLATQQVGTVATTIGSGSSTYALSGAIYNVTPNASEPARFSAAIPVVVGPYDLGKLTIPVPTTLRSDLGVDATAQLPLRYEGIAVRIRTMQMVLAKTANGNPFMINPSKCQSATISSTMTSEAPVSNVVSSFNFTPTGCAGFGSAPSVSVTPSTTTPADPVGLTFNITSAATNPTIKRIQLTFPTGMEINPAFANGLATCSTANINAGGASCAAASQVATVTMTTPLLGTNPTGKVYLEDPGNTAATRYKLAMVIDLPGQKLIVRGAVTLNGSTDIPTASTGATGSVDTGTGQISADFDNIPDLGFTSLSMVFTSGANAMMVNPETCSNSFGATFTPNSNTGLTSSSSPAYNLSGCGAFGFDPSFTASVSNSTPAGNPNLTLNVTRADKQKTLKTMAIHLPTGLVANTSAVASPCSQASAAAASCATTAASSQVGTFTTSFGSGPNTYSLSTGKIFQVTPNASEPARFAAIVPVLVGPYNLGNMTIPVSSSIRADYGIDVSAQLPQRYEGIQVRLRTLSMVLNGTVNSQNYITNPSKCQSNTISADFTAGDNSSDTSSANNSSTFTTSGCSTSVPPYNPTITASVNPTAAGNPTALTLGVNVPAGNATTSRVQIALPPGMELNPGVGNGLVACGTVDTDGGSSCKLTTANLATVTLNTPLLPSAVTGEVFLETPGNTAATRYKLALVLHLPGRDMIIHGGTLVNGSTTIPTGGLGSTDPSGTATGQVTADFPNIPDLGFTNMTIAFSSTNKLLVNPKTANTFTVNGTLTPNSTASTKPATANFTTSGGTTAVTGFSPTFSASISPSTSAANPDLTLNIGNPLGMQELKSFGIKLPVGLVANTTAVTRCSQANADAGNCLAANAVGTATTTFGSSDTVGQDYTVTGTIYNVIPNADQPARLQAVVPVVVGPFDLGKLSIPVPTSLNSDLTVTASASLPSRYEGIAVRVRQLNMVVQGQPNGNKFMVAPTKCGSSNISATMVSDASNSSTVSSAINVTGCPTNFASAPTFQVTPDTTTRTTPVNLTFKLTTSANNPTIGRVQVAMPAGMEINPGFANNLAACATATIDSDANNCPATSQIGTVSLKTQLLDPTVAYTGKVYLESPGTTAATRYKIALVVALPGANLVVHGKVAIDGSTDITGGTGAVDSGTGQITADFPSIPDLGFTEMTMAFSSTNPMLINPQTCSPNTFQATVTPSSNGTNATPSSAYTTTPSGCIDQFAPTFSVSVDGASSTTAGGHPDLKFHVGRPAGVNQRYLRNFNLDLPIGLVAATTATTHCSQANANAGNCAGDQLVGDFDAFVGNGAVDATNNLELQGGIYNVDPDPNEPAKLAAITNVVVGPYDLGKLVIPVDTTLNSDLSVSTTTQLPKRYEGIAVRISNVDITLYGQAPSGNPFVLVPSKCQTNTVTAHMTSDIGTTSNKTSSFTTTGCPQNFNVTPTVGVTATPSDTTVPTGLGVTIGSDPTNSTISRFQLALPAGMSINADAGNGLATCSAANINAGGASCPASSNQGTVALQTPLLNGTYNGNVYLEDPGSTGATRYKLAIVVHLPGTNLILRGKVNVDGSTTIPTGGLGATDTGTGQITTDFDTIPDLSFSSMQINFNTGNRALLTNADTCGTQTVSSTITPSAGGSNANVNSTFSLSNTLGCAGSMPFNPTFTATAASSTSGANTDLTMKVFAGAKNQYLRNFNLHLPVGLVADTTATTTTCSQAQAAAATCTAASKVGSVTTKLGTGGETLDLTGSIYNVTPNSNEPARMAVIVPVVVGPYDLGKLTVPVPTSLRSGDYGVDATATLPYRYEGISVRLAELDMTLFGTADQGTGTSSDDKGFIKNPSKCDDGTNTKITADLVPLTGSTVTRTANYPVTGCPRNFSPNPTLTVSGTTGTTAVPTGMTLQFDSAASNPTIGSVVTTMPAGMTLNPAVANANGGLAACSTANIDAGGAACPAGSKIGDVSLVTPLLPGTKTGSIYLETPGSTAATRYKLAMIVDLPGTKLIVRGTTAVNGSSDLSGGLGATDGGAPTGRVVAMFNSIPDLGFTQLTLTFNGGPDALFTNSETAGTQTVSADITPQSGGSTITANGSFSTVYGGSGSQGSEPFNPTFATSFSTLDAAANPDVTITVNRSDYTQQLKDFDLHLPPGLVANTVLTPRCSQANAAAGTCAASSRVGTVTTKIGTGSDTLSMAGTLYNVIPDASEPARLQVVVPVVVGPYDLGKLSLPVTTQIVTGAQASDLSIDTHTTLPKWYEGVPVRVRQLQIKINGLADQGTPADNSDDKPFMINPSQCSLHTLSATMTSTIGNSVTVGSPGGDFTTINCASAPYNPGLTAALSTTQRGKPVGLDLGFAFTGNSSSTKKIVTTFPQGMSINPGVGNYGAGMTCADATVQAGGAGCPSASKLGTVTLDTPLLPTTQTGALYLLPPLGNQASTRYRLGLFVDLPGSGDLYTSGSVTVDGSSDVPTGGTGAVDSGTGQVKATFDNLPDLQFNNLTIHFKTTGAGEHALLTNPTTCGNFTIDADMSPWSNPGTSKTASAGFTTTDTVSCADTQNAAVTAEIGDPNTPADFNNPSGPAYYAGASQPVTLTVNRPDSDKSIKRVKILLPPGLVGSADAAPTCLQADADAGNCGTTEPNSQIGTVTLQIGDSSDTYQIQGGLYNTVAPSNRPAKFTFSADVNVGPFQFGKVVVPIDVNLDNNDYSLFAETGDMPQVFEGIPVRISQMKVFLVATSLTNNRFMSNPRSCSSTLNVRADITAPDASVEHATAPLAGPFTNCGSLNLNADTVTVDNHPVAPEVGHGAEHPTGLSVKIHQDETLSTQATMKKMTLALPGFRLSAPAANGLAACSAAQLDAQTCPAASKVGTAWLDTSLLPKNQVNPDDAGDTNLHSLWGSVYLETPGTASDGSDRYKLAIQLSGKTLITIRGTAIVNETDNNPIPGKAAGEITTVFDNLPDIPFTDFNVDLTGYKKTVASTDQYFPLLLNPEGNVGSASTSTASADLVPHSGTAPVNRTSTLNVDAAPTKTFTPDSTSDIAPLTSGAHPNAEFTISRGDAQQDIKTVTMQLPAGFLGSAAAVPLCTVANAQAGNCTDQSKVGDVIAKIGQYGQTLTLPGKVYLTEGISGDIAGMSIKVPAKAGPYDLGDYITQGRILIRPSDHGVTVNFDDVPKMFKGVPTHIQNMDITLPGVAASTQKPFLYNASDCSPFQIQTTLTPYVGGAVTNSDPYQATGCPSRTFSPTMSFTASNVVDDMTSPSWTIKMAMNPGDSTLGSTTVTLPSVMTVNVAGLNDACSPQDVNARTCPASSKIGTVAVNTPLLSSPVTGTVYMAKSISGSGLPDLLMDIPAPIDMQIRGANRFLNAANAASQIQSTFTNLPDLIWSDMTMSITGGPKGILSLRDNGVCGSASTVFDSHSGQHVNSSSPVLGLDGYCASLNTVCANPTVKLSSKGAKKKGNKKAATSLTLTTASNCQAMKSVRVTYPKGTKLNKKLIVYNKKKKETKKNLKNVTGRAGTLKLTSKDFQVSGSNGLKIKTAFPAGTRSLSIATKNSALVLPFKTFCGGLKKAKLKKCKKKNVTFTFEITNVDGTAYRYNYTVPAGSKFFK